MVKAKCDLLLGLEGVEGNMKEHFQFWTIERGHPHIAFWKAELIVNAQSIPLFKSSNEKLYYVFSVQPPLINMAIQNRNIFFKAMGVIFEKNY